MVLLPAQGMDVPALAKVAFTEIRGRSSAEVHLGPANKPA
jgi:hypothetical protein